MQLILWDASFSNINAASIGLAEFYALISPSDAFHTVFYDKRTAPAGGPLVVNVSTVQWRTLDFLLSRFPCWTSNVFEDIWHYDAPPSPS